MKSFFLLLLCLLFGSAIFAQTKTVVLNNHTFEFREIHIDSLQKHFVEVYRGNQKLLSHTLYKDDGDCSSTQVELGGYEVAGNGIVFYTYWAAADRQSLLTYPFGARKQVYTVLPAGGLKPAGAEIYLEDYVEEFERNGIAYLRTGPKGKSQTETLRSYIAHIEKAYSAQFVTGKSKQLLLAEVRRKLRKEIKKETGHWKEIYGAHTRM